ncbi:hypothetical protein LSAT2_003412 [Lamellibrachia satsuma]|nr:hypothetical protein LSAT2_003412 [Lamellibrachia satsuma]
MKAKILLSYGEHAREFFPIESLIHLLSNLTDGLEPSASKVAKEFSHAILSNIDLFIVAMMNPDGRCYIERTGNHCWRGTSTGVDLNRNFDWYFGRRGSSADSKDEEYRGPRAFSEPECNILLNLTARFSFDAFVSLHSGIRQIYVPFADSVSKQTRHKPGNLNAMLGIAQKMSHATSKKFTYGIAYHLNDYTADGTIFDYMAGVRKIPFSFAIELWGEVWKHARCFDLFNPTNENLQAEVEQVHPIYEVLFLYLIKWKRKQAVFVSNSQRDPPPSHTFNHALVLCVILLTAYVAVHNRRTLSLWLRRRRRVIRTAIPCGSQLPPRLPCLMDPSCPPTLPCLVNPNCSLDLCLLDPNCFVDLCLMDPSCSLDCYALWTPIAHLTVMTHGPQLIPRLPCLMDLNGSLDSYVSRTPIAPSMAMSHEPQLIPRLPCLVNPNP